MSNVDYNSNLGQNALLSAELNSRIRDILTPLLLDFNSYLYTLLLQNYHRVSSIPKFTDARNLPIANYDPIPTWERILRVGLDVIDRSFPGNQEVVSNALFRTMELVGQQQKVEYFSLKHLATATESSVTEDQLRLMLVHYHDVYDGGYKIALSFFHLVCDMISGRYDGKKTFDQYLEDDVTFKIRSIKAIAESVTVVPGLEWLLLGADNHVRNAVAHKNWRFTEGTVILSDRDGWTRTLGMLELEDIVKNITIAIIALEASLTISFSKYEKEMLPFIGSREYDFESIHSVMYHFAEDQGFILDDLTSVSKGKLKSILIDKPQPHGSSELTMRDGPFVAKATIPPPAPRSERALGFVFQSLSVLNGYEQMEVVLLDFKQTEKGRLAVNLKRWIELACQKGHSKPDFESAVTRTSVIDD